MSKQTVDETQKILARLIPVAGIHEHHTKEPSEPLKTQRRLVAELQRAWSGERARGIAGHWSFDANRLIGLEQAHRHALETLLHIRTGSNGPAQNAKKAAARKRCGP